MTEAAFFDLDKTIIAKSSVLAFGKPFYREGLLSKGAIVKSIYAQIVFMLVGADEAKMEKLREAMLSLTKGWNQQHIADIVRETLDEVISPIVFAEALELFDQHQAAGRRVVIVSSAPFEVVGPLGEFLGADEVIATRAEIDAEGNYTGELAFYAYGPHKADEIRKIAEREGIDLSASYAYSDSVTDLPMLEAVGHPVAVNPDRELARVARSGTGKCASSSGPCGCVTVCRSRRRVRRSRSGRCSRRRVRVPPAYVWWRRALRSRSFVTAVRRRAGDASRPRSSAMDRLAASFDSRADAAREARRPHRARARRQQGAQARAPLRRGDRREGCDTLVTGGGAQSNHARMTAAAASRLGLWCHLALASREPERTTATCCSTTCFGATLHFTGARDYYEIEASIDALAAEARGSRTTAVRDPGRRRLRHGRHRVRARDRRAAYPDRTGPGLDLRRGRVRWHPRRSPRGTRLRTAATRVVGVDVGTRPDLDEVVPRLAAEAVRCRRTRRCAVDGR